MKIIFFIAALAALQLTAAAQTINVHLKDGQVIDYPLINVDFIDFSKPENPDDHPVDPQQPSEERAVCFDVYARQNVTRSAVTGDLGISDLASVGIGVFSYYTGNQGYVAGMALPDFLYNEKVTGNYSYGTYSWEYAPIKYWPDNGYVSFFAYAPWTQATSVTRSGETDDTKNIVAVSRNTDWGDPFVKYVVDSNPNTAVDLLWGVAAPNVDSYYQGTIDGNKVNVTEGMPFTNLWKPQGPDSKVKFKMLHALSWLNIVVDLDNQATIDNNTRIYVRSVKIGGCALKGRLNLNNTMANRPNWTIEDGAATFYDGRKDGKEGQPDAVATNEEMVGLNPNIIENYSSEAWPLGKTSGVTQTAVNLFGDGTVDLNAPIYVIPKDNEDFSIEVCYDIETRDDHLAAHLSDGKTQGSSIENRITKTLSSPLESNKAYKVHLHLGLMSIKCDLSIGDLNNGSENISF